MLDQVADQFPADCYPHLQQLLKLKPGDGPPLLAVAARYFFRIEVQADDTLFHGLTFDAMGRVEKSQREGFDALGEMLADHGDLLDACSTWSALAQAHAAVLDLREQPQGQVAGPGIYDGVIGLKAKLDLFAPRCAATTAHGAHRRRA